MSFDERLFGRRPVVFILRCPYDVMVSEYFQKTRQDFSWQGPLKAFLRDPEVGVADLVRYLNSWAPWLQTSRALVLTYEQLRHDPETGFLRLAAHLGIQTDRAVARAALSEASFGRMREVERRFGIEGYDYDWTDPRRAASVRRKSVATATISTSRTAAISAPNARRDSHPRHAPYLSDSPGGRDHGDVQGPAERAVSVLAGTAGSDPPLSAPRRTAPTRAEEQPGVAIRPGRYRARTRPSPLGGMDRTALRAARPRRA